MTVQTLSTIGELQAAADAARVAGKHIALVPTMGALHKGHISLIERARSMADVVVTSIFVNPAQFGPQEDFEKYPRDLVRDSAQAQAAGTDILFTPDVAVMYPRGFQTYIDNNRLATILEGLERPGHFRGVATVVTKLLNAAKPHIAVFGQKDAQQAALVHMLARDLNIDVEIVVAPIVREPDGLALSSRNIYLSPEQRKNAVALHRSLEKAAEMVRAGERSLDVLRDTMRAVIEGGNPTKIDYIAFVHPETFEPMSEVDPRGTLVVVTVRFGDTRLLDNEILRNT